MAIADNVWWTRKAKIHAEKRLLSGAFQAQLILLWYSFCSVAASIYYLKFNMQSEFSGIAWVVLSVLVLSMSGFVNGLGYKERAALVKDSYEALGSLYQKVKLGSVAEDGLSDEYEQILNVCENHLDIDYYMALCQAHLEISDAKGGESGLSKHPTPYIWLRVVGYLVVRALVLSVLYLLPVIIFAGMEFA